MKTKQKTMMLRRARAQKAWRAYAFSSLFSTRHPAEQIAVTSPFIFKR